MKKQIVSLLLAAAVSASALGLVACGDDNNDGSDGVLKSDKVATAAEWAAAFDFSEVTNATVFCKTSGTYYEEEYEAYMKLDNEKMESTNVDEEGNLYYFMYKPEELSPGWDNKMYGTMYKYSYDKEAKKWTCEKYGTDYSASHNFRHFIQDLNEDLTPFYISEKFSDFEYDENNYEYVATWDKLVDEYSTWENLTIKIKIKNGKIAEGSIDLNHIYESEERKQEGTISCEFKIYDIGTTKVEIPEAEIPPAEEEIAVEGDYQLWLLIRVDDEIWNAKKLDGAIYNFNDGTFSNADNGDCGTYELKDNNFLFRLSNPELVITFVYKDGMWVNDDLGYLFIKPDKTPVGYNVIED